MLLLHLPNELLQCIAEKLDLQRDINSFAQANTRLYNLLNTYLYRHNVQQLGGSALLWAAKHGKVTTAKKSLKEGAPGRAIFESNPTPLMLAAENGHEAVVRLLLATEGVSPDFKDSRGYTPLLQAAKNGHGAVVKLLLSEGVNLDSKDFGTLTPLAWAANNGHEVVVKLLIAEGARARPRMLSRAAKNGHEAVVKLLLGEGINPYSKDCRGQIPLSCAVKNGREAVVKLLLGEGARPLQTKDSVEKSGVSQYKDN